MKIMQRFVNALAAALLAMSIIQSCDLTLLPEDSTTPKTFFKNESDLQLWTNRFYTMLETADAAAALNADDVVDRNFQDIIAGTRSAATESGWSWSHLRNINYCLQYSSNCEDLEVRRHYEGVAYFFRAYFYYVKVRRYGDVPWYDKVIDSGDSESLTRPRDDRGYVMDRVMEDFDRAIDMLPAEKSVSRVTKWTAMAFKSRAALYEGTFRKYHGYEDWEKYLQACSDAAGRFIRESGYTLYDEGAEPYRDLFCSDQAKSEEVVLARIYNFPDLNLPTSIQQNIINDRQGFTKRFMNHYLMKDGTRFTDIEGYGTMPYTEETQDRDPRMAQTVLCPGYIQKGTSVVTANNLNSSTGYQPIKFVATPAQDGASKGTADWPLMRAAEVYLNYAEAKAELGTLTQDDLDISVNRIRARADMVDMDIDEANANPDEFLKECYPNAIQPDNPNMTDDSNAGVILEIRRERTVEMVMEGLRQWDMLRWKEGAQMVNEKTPFLGCYIPGPGLYDMDNDGTDDLEIYEDEPGGTVTTIKRIGTDIVLSDGDHGNIVAFPTVICTWNEERDYLWPIPADQRVLTSGALTQNPGWVDGVDL